MSIIQGNAHTSAGGYQIERSLRFNSADSAYLSRTPASAGNRRTFTWSGWVKRSALGEANLFSADSATGTTGYLAFSFNSTDNLQLQIRESGANRFVTTSAVYRDVSSWYHVVIAVDTTQATAANRRKMYVNGVEITSFGTSNDITQNFDTSVNNTVVHQIGVARTSGSGYEAYQNGYLTEVNFIDGSALTPSSFGETDSATGVWKPKAYSGTYGTNGFYLKFADNSGTTSTTLGKDSSGNGNNWTPNNFSVTAGAGNDSLVDSPTSYGTDTGVGGEVRGNYATLNPLRTSNAPTNGNLDVSFPTASRQIGSTIALPSSGKWYFEATLTALSAPAAQVGVSGLNYSTTNYGGQEADSYVYSSGAQKANNNSFVAYGASWTTNDVIGVAADVDAGSLTFYKNGVSQGAAYTGISLVNKYFVVGMGGTSINFTVNFGQRAFAYTAPSGFKALCTQNLPTPTIGATSTTQANDYFNAVLYTGNGTTNTITGVGFQPDFVWAKARSVANWHILSDVVRGATSYLHSNNTDAEGTNSAVISSFNSDGFTLGSNTTINGNGDTNVAWNWKANGAGSSNTAGTITSTVSANTTSGFSIVTYTGTGALGTVGHGLGVTPSMIIVKRRNSTGDWAVYNSNLSSPENNQLLLNSTAAAPGSSAFWGNQPSSSVFSVWTSTTTNASGGTFVAYCFAEVAGYSAFGSYTGNGSTDGPFVFTNFRPRYVLVKRTDTTGNWRLQDTSRNEYNTDPHVLFPNLSDAEGAGSTNDMDILSNGFKARNNSTNYNASGGTYIYAAFAETPAKFSLAR